MGKALENTDMKESGFSAFCKEVPKCESQTSSGEVADLSDYAGKRFVKVNQLGPPLHTGQAYSMMGSTTPTY